MSKRESNIMAVLLSTYLIVDWSLEGVEDHATLSTKVQVLLLENGNGKSPKLTGPERDN